jgi:hypothetical protein
MFKGLPVAALAPPSPQHRHLGREGGGHQQPGSRLCLALVYGGLLAEQGMGATGAVLPNHGCTYTASSKFLLTLTVVEKSTIPVL